MQPRQNGRSLAPQCSRASPGPDVAGAAWDRPRLLASGGPAAERRLGPKPRRRRTTRRAARPSGRPSRGPSRGPSCRLPHSACGKAGSQQRVGSSISRITWTEARVLSAPPRIAVQSMNRAAARVVGARAHARARARTHAHARTHDRSGCIAAGQRSRHDRDEPIRLGQLGEIDELCAAFPGACARAVEPLAPRVLPPGTQGTLGYPRHSRLTPTFRRS